MSPKYQHDCVVCTFIATIAGMDVYICGKTRRTIIARFSDDGPDYTSQDLEMFRDMIKNNVTIGVAGLVLKYRDYLVSEHASDYHKAWLIALTLIE